MSMNIEASLFMLSVRNDYLKRVRQTLLTRLLSSVRVADMEGIRLTFWIGSLLKKGNRCMKSVLSLTVIAVVQMLSSNDV